MIDSIKVHDSQIKPLVPFGVQILPHEDFSILQLGRDQLLELTSKHKIILFRDFPTFSREELLNLCSNDPEKELLHWDFGPVMEMKVTDDPKNYLFSTENVPYHWDGAFHTVPSYLVFNCIQAPTQGCGGETIFCNTERILEKATEEQEQLWTSLKLTYETEKKAHYGGKIEVDMVEKHPHTQDSILRYAEPVETDLNPVFMDVKGIAEDKKTFFMKNMKELIYSDDFCYQHQWQEGDFLVVDNHSVIHGRNAFTQNCPRHLRRIQIL